MTEAAPDYLEEQDAPEGMTDEEIVSRLRTEADAASQFYNTELADRQENALDFYDCQPFGDEEEGRSQFIEPVVEQTIDDMTVDIMEAFVSGDRVVEFEANDEGTEQAAAEATEAMHYLFMRKQRGYRTTLDWLQSGLVETLGVVKVCCTEEKKVTKGQEIFTEDEIADMDLEGVSAANDNGDGTFTLELKTEKMVKRYEVMPLPSEEFKFSPRMKSLDDKVYKAHCCSKTVSDLIEMGFDRDIVENLSTETSTENNDSRENARWRDDNHEELERKGPNRKVLLWEEYDYIDIDGDGIAELVKAFRVDSTLLSIEPWEEQPFVGFCPYPRAHRLVGKGLAEKVMPDQLVESTITRQMLDGLYQTNSPRRWLPEESTGESTIDDLLVVRPGAIIRGKGLNPPANMSENFDLSKSLSVLDRFSQRRQSRTGILELGKGMDKDALNDTARGQAQLMQAGEKQIRYVARNFGEAMAEMFLKLMRLVRLHGEEMTIKVGNQFQPINPQEWPEEMDVSIRVGLGTNGKDKRIAYRQMIVEMQAEAFQGNTGLVDAVKLYNSASGLVRDMGLGEPSDYWIDPEGDDFKPPEPQADPAIAKAQQDQQMQAQKIQGEQQLAAVRLQGIQAEAAEKSRLAREQAEEQAQLARERAEFEAEMAIQRQDNEMALAERKLTLETAMNMAKADSELSENRAGGDLDK